MRDVYITGANVMRSLLWRTVDEVSCCTVVCNAWRCGLYRAALQLGQTVGSVSTKRLKRLTLTFRRRIKSRLQFAGIIIRSSPYSTGFQD